MSIKPTVYLTSNVFLEIASNEKINPKIRQKIEDLLRELKALSNLHYFNGRFPKSEELEGAIAQYRPDILGCHLSHPISRELLSKSNLFAISTSTAGYNHISRTQSDDILIAHTPGVLHETVADYTIALIMANLRNIIDLHQHVWDGEWVPEDKWDLDQSLSSVIDDKVLGIVGMGEIGTELMKRLNPWGLKVLYYDIRRREDLEAKYDDLVFKEKLDDIFKEADIITLHLPLNKHTEKIIDRSLLKLMKKNALLVNTARGPVLDLDALLDLLEKKEIKINLAFDVFPIEPIKKETLQRLKTIKKDQPEIRMILMPHNASADADTRGKMDIIFLENIIGFVKSSTISDLGEINIIPEHRSKLESAEWKIETYWKRKEGGQ